MQHFHQIIMRARIPKPAREKLLGPALPQQHTPPSHDIKPIPIQRKRGVKHLLIRQQLEKNHPITVHVSLIRNPTRHRVLRCDVPESPRYASCRVGLRGAQKSSQPEIRQVSIVILVEKNIARFYVSVEDTWHALVVQVRQRVRDVQSDFVEDSPVDCPSHQEHLVFARVVTDQRHEVRVAKPAERLDLRVELLDALKTANSEALDGDKDTWRDLGLERGPESPIADTVARVEIPRGADHVFEGEGDAYVGEDDDFFSDGCADSGPGFPFSGVEEKDY
ncbi:heat shock protein DnaJ with tetratricopeptiderepeat [Striga asiatica]|uniref:Heat shock protein DnaJ with tetratricopeptiderepeat n=1 Tax=Striga asiatica TaxID=4170 RepID=A0A5A7QWK6_STRAF|nr:heat shock protein DnaJ with tetratricopeptiderepeat [Striga asiatica]